MPSVKEQRKLKGVPRKSNAHRQARKYLTYRQRVGRPNGPGAPGNKKGKGRLARPVSPDDASSGDVL